MKPVESFELVHNATLIERRIMDEDKKLIGLLRERLLPNGIRSWNYQLFEETFKTGNDQQWSKNYPTSKAALNAALINSSTTHKGDNENGIR